MERAAKEDERKQKDDVLTRYILYIDNILFEIGFCGENPSEKDKLASTDRYNSLPTFKPNRCSK